MVMSQGGLGGALPGTTYSWVGVRGTPRQGCDLESSHKPRAQRDTQRPQVRGCPLGGQLRALMCCGGVLVLGGIHHFPHEEGTLELMTVNDKEEGPVKNDTFW